MSAMPLDKAQARVGRVLDFLPALHLLPPKLARPNYLLLDRLLGLKKVKLEKVEDLSIVSNKRHKINMRCYYPNTGTVPQAALMYFHGGGCAIGSLATHDRLCRFLAQQSQIVIISVDYRLGPEAKYPAAIEDAIEAWNWLNQNSARLKLDPQRLGVGGDSAGAYLAALIGLPKLQQQLDVQSQAPAKFQYLLYPMLDLRGQSDSFKKHTKSQILTQAMMLYFRQHYLNDISQSHEALASPLLHDDFSQMPKTYLLSLGYDPLSDDGLAFAEKLELAGIDIKHQHFGDCMHAFISTARVSARARQACYQIGEELKQLSQG